MLQKLRGNNSKGFTLIELMIVIAIIGILAAIAIPNFINYRNKAYCSKVETDAQNMIAAMASYFADPDRTSIPSTQDLVDAEELMLNNDTGDATITTSGTGAVIEVTDTANKCPRVTKDTETFWTYFGTEGTAGWG